MNAKHSLLGYTGPLDFQRLPGLIDFGMGTAIQRRAPLFTQQ